MASSRAPELLRYVHLQRAAEAFLTAFDSDTRREGRVKDLATHTVGTAVAQPLDLQRER